MPESYASNEIHKKNIKMLENPIDVIRDTTLWETIDLDTIMF
jgi:hypothetical protein